MTISSFSEALGWTLVHSLWQASLVALAFYLIRQFVRRPTHVYLMAVGALLCLTGWSLFTWVEVYKPDHLPTSPIATDLSLADAPSTLSVTSQNPIWTQSPSAASWLATLTTWIDPYTRFIAIGWAMGMTILLARLGGGLWYLSRLKRLHTTPLPAWETTLATLASQLRLRRPVTILASYAAQTPMVIGHFKPVILFPVALATNLPPEQIEAIVAHELAHIYRQDYWINILQSIVETIFFYHPAVRWISSVVREEREKCCDDLAVSLCGDTVVYATALSQAEALQHTDSLALAFAQSRSGLLARIERLVRPSASSTSPTLKLLSVVLMLLTVVCLAVGDSIAHRAERGESWLTNDLFGSSALHQRAPAVADTTQPEENSVEDDGWRESDKARAFAIPLDPDTIPNNNDHDCGGCDAITEEQEHFSFHFDDGTDVRLDLDLDIDHDIAILDDSFIYLNLDDDDAFRKHVQIHIHDTLPAGVWDDSLWLESLGELGEQMGAFSEELKDIITDSIATEELHKRLESVQRELGQLQAELGSSLRWSFNEERMEAWQRRMEAEQERVQRNMERIQERVKESQRRVQERQQQAMERAKERQVEAQARAHGRAHRDFDDTVDRLERELLADGLIKRGKEYRFELKPRGLYINRKKQDDDLLEKYRELLSVSENTNFSITRTAE